LNEKKERAVSWDQSIEQLALGTIHPVKVFVSYEPAPGVSDEKGGFADRE